MYVEFEYLKLIELATSADPLESPHVWNVLLHHPQTHTHTHSYKLTSTVYSQTHFHTPSHLYTLLHLYTYRLTDSHTQKHPYTLMVTHTLPYIPTHICTHLHSHTVQRLVLGPERSFICFRSHSATVCPSFKTPFLRHHL